MMPLLAGLERALQHGGGTHDIDDLQRQLADGTAHLWPSDDGLACLVTELVDYPRARLLRYWLAAGELHRVLELQPQIETWAASHGARLAVMQGRRGWVKVLPKWGWKPTAVAMVKDLTR